MITTITIIATIATFATIATITPKVSLLKHKKKMIRRDGQPRGFNRSGPIQFVSPPSFSLFFLLHRSSSSSLLPTLVFSLVAPDLMT